MIRQLAVALAALLLAGCAADGARTHAAAPQILLVTHATGYRHQSIEPGADAIAARFEREGMAVTRAPDPARFTDAGLAPFDAIVLLGTTTDPDDPASEWLRGSRGEAFRRWFAAKGAVVGIHAAADSHYGWPWYGAMLGSQFQRHPPGTPRARLEAVSGWGLPASFALEDEWYLLRNVAPDVTLLASLDPVSIGEAAGPRWPVSYTHAFEGGRVFYTSLGHRTETYADPRFLDHVVAGTRLVLGRQAKRPGE